MDGGIYAEKQGYEIIQSSSGAFEEVGIVSMGNIGYRDSVDIIRKELDNIKQSFLAVGWHLKHIKDRGLYKEDGYTNIYDFAGDKFHMSQSNVSRYINLCERFSAGNGSPRLDERFAGFDYSQLTEMLPMKPEEQEKVTPDMTVRQIREMKKKIKKQVLEDVPEENGLKEYATSHTGDVIEIPVIAEGKQQEMPGLDSDGTREQWLRNVEAWGLWYEDPNIQARYYKYDFSDRSRLIAVKYRYTCPPFMLKDMSQYREEAEADGSYYGEPVYHMIYSDGYWDRHPDEYQKGYKRYYSHDNTSIAELVNFLQELYSQQSCCEQQDTESVSDESSEILSQIPDSFASRSSIRTVSDALEEGGNKEPSYVTCQYFKFYKEHGYIPKYFNVKDCTEVTEYEHTLAADDGAAKGSIAVFDILKNIEDVIKDETITRDEQDDRIKKLLKIAKPEERNTAVKKLLEWRQ